MLSATATVFVLLLCQADCHDITGASWPWILLLGIVNAGFGCWCYFSAIRLAVSADGGGIAAIWSRWSAKSSSPALLLHNDG